MSRHSPRLKDAPASRQQIGPGFSNAVARDVVKQFRVLFGTARQHYRQVEASCGLGGAQLWALTEIAHTPGISVRDLATALLIHHSTASNLVERIETLGLVSKRRAADDRRLVCLFATAAGKKVLSRAPAPTIGILPDTLQRLPLPVLESLNADMKVVIATMSRKFAGSAAKPLADL